MHFFESFVSTLEYYTWQIGPTIDGQSLPLLILFLLGTGIFLTLRMGFLQIRKLPHGFAVASGRYDNPDEPGDVSHFQALCTALSATVGIGNIAGVAIAIHFGGPGALFWMWVTAALGMVTKYTEVTLALHFRTVDTSVPDRDTLGTVAGGPMYYIERGLGPAWKPLAIFFAFALMLTAFVTGNSVQANTVADLVNAEWGWPTWITGLITALIVFSVIVGGIKRIGAVTGVLAPLMAAIYVTGGIAILIMHFDQVPSVFTSIFREAFNPTAGVAGTGTGVFLLTMMWGVRRGLFSNEAGQGSSPIAHSAARTDEPVSEGVVALLEPFIDTIVICSITGMVILITGVATMKHPAELPLNSGNMSVVTEGAVSLMMRSTPLSMELRMENGELADPDRYRITWNDVAVEKFYVDPEMQEPFTGTIFPRTGRAVTDTNTSLFVLYGDAVETGAPLTSMAFAQGLGRLAVLGRYIVLVCVILFAISTAIAWSYYGDRCAHYLFGPPAVLPYRLIFVAMHFGGAVLPLATVWTLGDVAIGLVTFPNLLALILLSGLVARLTKSYFERQPWKTQPKNN